MRKHLSFDDFCKKEAIKLQKELASLNEFKHRDPRVVNNDLKLYNACQKVRDCVDEGGNAGDLLTQELDREMVEHKKYVEYAKQSGDWEHAPPTPWLTLNTHITIAAMMAEGDLTESDLESAHRKAREEMYGDAV